MSEPQFKSFDKWFVAQFGPKPRGNHAKLSMRVFDLESELAAAEKTLDEIQRWEDDYRAARYAFNVIRAFRAIGKARK